MASESIRKAALLLTTLEPPAAAELLKAADPTIAMQIAAELAYLEATGETASRASEAPLREFSAHLQGKAGGMSVKQMLEGVFGPERSREVLGEVTALLAQRDPFLPVRSADPASIADALRGESPQVAGLVLAELPPKTSSKLLPLLDEEVRTEAVRGMTREDTVTPETRLRVATVVRDRLAKAQARGGGEQALREKQLRKVATLLRSLSMDLRTGLLDAIAETDEATRKDIERLMVVWDDLRMVSDRSLQDALRAVDARSLALALSHADEAVVQKLRANMSERQSAMLDEEAALLASPGEEEVGAARNQLLEALRELAANNMLTFEEE